MKNFLSVKKKIKLLSQVTSADYEGNRFLLILRTSGAQLCLLDNQTNEYCAQKLSEFKFYYAQCRDAQFYFYDGANLAAIDPLKALKKIARGIERFDATQFHLNTIYGLRNEVKDINIE